jgi:hypothetical protein
MVAIIVFHGGVIKGVATCSYFLSAVDFLLWVSYLGRALDTRSNLLKINAATR